MALFSPHKKSPPFYIYISVMALMKSFSRRCDDTRRRRCRCRRLRLVVALLLFHSWWGCCSARAVFATQKTFKKVVTHVVLIHGMGDTCCNPSSLGAIEEAVKKATTTTTTKVMSIRFGTSEASDFISGFLGNAFRLVHDYGCEQIVREARKEEGSETILLGFSQGGVFARAMVELCGDEANVKKLITFGAPHAGVWKFPGCDRMASTASRKWCEYSRKVASKAAYSKMWKSKSVQASYFRDVSDKERFETYERSGSLLSVINGEEFFDDANTTTKSVARQNDEQRRRRRRRRERMCNLDLFAMFSFEKDKVVVPKDSAVFSDAPSIPFEYTEEKASELLNVRQTKFYLNEEDGLCLRELDGKDRMKIDVVPNANHMQFSLDWFTENIVEKYLVEKKEKEVVVVQME